MDSQREISGVVEAVSASSVGVAQLARSLSGKIPLGRNVSPGKATSGKMSSHGSLPSAERMTKVAMSSEDVIGSTSRQPRALPANVGVDSDRQSTKSGKSTSANGLAFGTEVLSDTTPVASTGMLPNNRTWTVKYLVSATTSVSRDVTLSVVGTEGVVVRDPSEGKDKERRFRLEDIMQYSFNRDHRRFVIAHLERDGLLANYRFITEHFLEIHGCLGDAIAKVIANMTSQVQKAKQSSAEAGALSPSEPAPVMDARDYENVHALSKQELSSSATDPLVNHLARDGTRPQSLASTVADMINSDSASLAHGQHRSTATGSLRDFSDESTRSQLINGSPLNSASVDATRSDDAVNRPPLAIVVSGNMQSGSAVPLPSSSHVFSASAMSLPRSDAVSDPKSPSRSWLSLAATKSLKFRKKTTFSVDEKSTESLEAIRHDKTNEEIGVSTISKRFSLGRPSNRGGQAVDTRSSPALCTVAHEEDENSVPFLRKHDQFGRVVLNKTLKNGQYEITAGTLEALVEALADEKTPDTIYIEVFLLTFRHFTTPARVLELLHKRFHFESEDVRTAAVVRLRTVSVLKKWAERHYYDFRFSEVQALLGSFLDSIASTECAKFGVQIKSIIDAELERSKTFVAPAKPQAPKQIAAILAGVDFLSSTFTAKRIAQELILEDLRLFKQIKPDEFCIFLWGEKHDPRIANFNAYIDRFNRIGFWVGTTICTAKDPKQRAAVIEKFVYVMKYCFKYRNFNVLMAVFSGLNMASVSRLKKTWEIVGKSRCYGIFREVEAQMSYRGNFKAYRSLESVSKLPFVPFFGLYVKDLTFMNDGNQKHLQPAVVNELPVAFAISPINVTGKNNKRDSVMTTFTADTDSPSTPCTYGAASSLSSVSPLEYGSLMSPSTIGAVSLNEGGTLLGALSFNDQVEMVLSPGALETGAADAAIADAPPLSAMINFEKCRTISDKIHAIRIFQQSSFKFSAEEREEAAAGSGGIFGTLRNGTMGGRSGEDSRDLEVYVMHPFGPPCIDDEARLLELSRECEASDRANNGATAMVLK